jgi:hypothetical protein
MARPIAKLLTGFFAVAAVLLVVALVLTLSRSAPAPPPMPNPNGYDDFVRASAMIPEDVGDYQKMSLHELQAVAGKNAEALKVAMVGLDRECRAPSLSLTINAALAHLSGVKRLARAMAATGRLAELEDRPGDAAAAYVAVIRLGNAVTQGGVIIDTLVGVAVQSIGTAFLARLVPKLDAKQCREAATALEACEGRREPVGKIMARERAWAIRTYGFKARIMRLMTFKVLKQNEQKATARVQAAANSVRAVLVQLAARAYELEKGERPKSLAGLVPEYLKTIPRDPITGTNMAIQP